MVLAVVSFGLSAWRVKDDLTDANDFTREGIDRLQEGDFVAAAMQLQLATESFDRVDDSLTSGWAMPAKIVPVLAQNRAVALDMLRSATEATARAADASRAIDPEELRVDDGHIIDEAHPFIFEESYALSKEVNERSALMWSRRCDTAFVGMRFPWTNTPEKTLELARRFNDEDNLPPDPRFPKGIVAKILWTYLDLRDAVKAIEVVFNSGITGSHVYNFAVPDIMAKTPTLELMKKFHPKTEIRFNLPGYSAPLSSQAFVDTFGFAPQYLINRDDI